MSENTFGPHHSNWTKRDQEDSEPTNRELLLIEQRDAALKRAEAEEDGRRSADTHLTAARADAEKYKAETERHIYLLAECAKERDALKARRVTLPQEYSERNGSHETKAEAYGYNKALSDCADAIRAAGVEVV